MRQRFMRMMQGRYGSDELNRTMAFTALACMILNFFVRNARIHSLIYLLGMICLILCYVRMFSRNYAKRSMENQKFLQMKARFPGRFGRGRGGYGSYGNAGYGNAGYGNAGGFNPFRGAGSVDKDHKIFKCPNCKQKIRVPKGKGKIEISCPRCRTSFIRRS